ncbi:MAG TPA: PHP domain-containing protein [Fibrobacteria bacterium]|nr:PHP domain-containing protein [Fibrobacteria bacterium]
MALAPLHVHSSHSLLRGIPSVAELVSCAKARGYRALALTDVQTMAGSILFLQECRRQGIRPILGLELADARDPSIRLVLLARNGAGYGDLCELATFRNLGRRGEDIEDLFARPFPDLFALCPDPALLQRLSRTPLRQSLFGALCLADEVSASRSRAVEAVCLREGLECAVAHDTWFLEPSDHSLHRLLRAIDANTDLSRLHPSQVAAPASWLLPPERLRELYGRHLQALRTTERIADSCQDDLPSCGWILPRVDVPDGHDDNSWLDKLVREGLERNYGGRPGWTRALELQAKELDVIRRTGYAGYFLMVREIRQAAARSFGGGFRRGRECSVLRGSAANSLTLYNLDASDLDPLRYGLYFERFLNEDRSSPPDADLDFGWDERPRVLEWFFETYGEDRVCILSATHHFRRRAAFRETAKVMGFSQEQVTEAFQRLRRAPLRPGLHWLERVHEVDPSLAEVARMASRVQGRPHFLGQHSGGVLVTNDPIWRHVSCQRSGGATNRVVSQVDMHGGIDFLGLVKFDILGNGSLSVLRDALEMLREQGGEDPELWDLAKVEADPDVRRMMEEGDTRGVFYIESPAQLRLNQRARASTFEEIGITSSLVRPAGTAYARLFVERHRAAKEGRADWDWLHASLEGILSQTHDVCVFQEDITRICVEVAGFSFAEADQVRKMMNSLHEGTPAHYERTERRFVEGCMAHRGLDAAQAHELWKRVDSFRGFSFCKSHSLSYAQLSFRCAWLKRHHPARFWAAVVGNDHGFYPTAAYMDEIRRAGIRLLPWDANLSRWRHQGGDGWFRPGFQHVRGVHRTTVDRLESERARGGAFQDLPDFCRRVAAARTELDALARVGAFDAFGLARSHALAWIAELGAGARRADSLDLFAQEGLPSHLLSLPRETPAMRALDELRLAGFSVSADPLESLGRLAGSLGAVANARLGEFSGKSVKIVGVPVASRVHRVRQTGEPMLFLTLSDQTGVADAILWPDAYRKFHSVAIGGGVLAVRGKVKEEDDTFALDADHVEEVRT